MKAGRRKKVRERWDGGGCSSGREKIIDDVI